MRTNKNSSTTSLTCIEMKAPIPTSRRGILRDFSQTGRKDLRDSIMLLGVLVDILIVSLLPLPAKYLLMTLATAEMGPRNSLNLTNTIH